MLYMKKNKLKFLRKQETRHVYQPHFLFIGKPRKEKKRNSNNKKGKAMIMKKQILENQSLCEFTKKKV